MVEVHSGSRVVWTPSSSASPDGKEGHMLVLLAFLLGLARRRDDARGANPGQSADVDCSQGSRHARGLIRI